MLGIIQGTTTEHIEGELLVGGVAEGVVRRFSVIAPLATVKVIDTETLLDVALFADADGITPIDNPTISDSYGRVEAFAAGEGKKKTIIVTTADGKVGRFVSLGLGSAAAYDVGEANDQIPTVATVQAMIDAALGA